MDKANISPISAGLKCVCPRCGEGALFNGYLKLADECPCCGMDYRYEDAGDGPASVVILFVGVLVVFPALLVEVAFKPPIWVHMLLWLPLATLLTLAVLRPFKAFWFAVMYRNNVVQGRGGLSETDEHTDETP
ncbi:MAG: hypothetical protein COA84_14310 [Robiginitomaculum sp.]|nr:MAG: hypothetical protein COA84_14310 [Robiginitomaculum sp.]